MNKLLVFLSITGWAFCAPAALPPSFCQKTFASVGQSLKNRLPLPAPNLIDKYLDPKETKLIASFMLSLATREIKNAWVRPTERSILSHLKTTQKKLMKKLWAAYKKSPQYLYHLNYQMLRINYEKTFDQYETAKNNPNTNLDQLTLLSADNNTALNNFLDHIAQNKSFIETAPEIKNAEEQYHLYDPIRLWRLWLIETQAPETWLQQKQAKQNMLDTDIQQNTLKLNRLLENNPPENTPSQIKKEIDLTQQELWFALKGLEELKTLEDNIKDILTRSLEAAAQLN